MLSVINTHLNSGTGVNTHTELGDLPLCHLARKSDAMRISSSTESVYYTLRTDYRSSFPAHSSITRLPQACPRGTSRPHTGMKVSRYTSDAGWRAIPTQ